MTDHVSYDLGSVNAPPPGMLAQGLLQPGRALTQAPAWRQLLRGSASLMQQGRDGREALNYLRPCLDSRNQQIAVNATLQRDEWKLLDEQVVTSYQEETVAVQDLLGRGLRLNLGNPFGTTVVESETVGEMTPAEVSMYAGTPPTNDRVEYGLVGVPVPIVSKGFWLDERVLEASRTRGQTLDTTNADAATRVVTEKLEELLFKGGPTYGGYTLYGYTTHPARNTGSLTGAWSTLAGTNPGAIINNILTMMGALADDNVNGQAFMLYIPKSWMIGLNRDYFASVGTPTDTITGVSGTILQRITSIPGIIGVRPTANLSNAVVLVDMTRRTVDVVFGFEPRLIQWETQGGMVNHFRVLSIMSFRIKADSSSRSGIAHYSV